MKKSFVKNTAKKIGGLATSKKSNGSFEDLQRISEIVRLKDSKILMGELKELRKLSIATSLRRPIVRDYNENVGFTSILANLYVSKNFVSLDKASDAFTCLEGAIPSAKMLGYIDFIKACLLNNHIDAAVDAYHRANSEGVFFDKDTPVELIRRLSLMGRVQDIINVVWGPGTSGGVNSLSTIVNCMPLLAEPLIISGLTNVYSDILIAYLDRMQYQWTTTNAEVAEVVSSIIYALIRRDVSNVVPTAKEKEGVSGIIDALKCYHLSIEDTVVADGYKINGLPSFMATAQLEKFHEHTDARLDDLLLGALPACDVSGENFPYLLEDKHLILEGTEIDDLSSKDKAGDLVVLGDNKNLVLNDLTHQLNKPRHLLPRPSSIIEYHKRRRSQARNSNMSPLTSAMEKHILFDHSVFDSQYKEEISEISYNYKVGQSNFKFVADAVSGFILNERELSGDVDMDSELSMVEIEEEHEDEFEDLELGLEELVMEGFEDEEHEEGGAGEAKSGVLYDKEIENALKKLFGQAKTADMKDSELHTCINRKTVQYDCTVSATTDVENIVTVEESDELVEDMKDIGQGILFGNFVFNDITNQLIPPVDNQSVLNANNMESKHPDMNLSMLSSTDTKQPVLPLPVPGARRV